MENFIFSIGFEPILSEKGSIAYVYDQPLDESCYREVGTADIFVLIIGGRYGSEVSSSKNKDEIKEFFDRYESITSKEHKHASDRGIPVYILIESAVYSEFQTFLMNKENEAIKYAHVSSINVFHFIESILGQERNNPMFLFSKYADIEGWLKEQWSGLLRELINRRSQQQQIETLNARINELSELTTTLKTYSEAILTTVNKKPETESLIKRETERIEQHLLLARVDNLGYINHLRDSHRLNVGDILHAIESSTSLNELLKQLRALVISNPKNKNLSTRFPCFATITAKKDINRVRKLLGKKDFEDDVESDTDESKSARRVIPRRRPSQQKPLEEDDEDS